MGNKPNQETLLRSNQLLPPAKLKKFVGGGDFAKIGESMLNLLIKHADLKSGEAVLDVGCGIGRIARCIVLHFGDSIRYSGFDVFRKGVSWCTENITPAYPSYTFSIVDVHNSAYNVTGKDKGSEYNFPYEDNSFDLVFLISVFTHMKSADTEQYISQISRVLKSGGRCFATWFLLNDESLESISRNVVKHLQFQYPLDDNSKTINSETPEKAIAFKEKYVINVFKQYGLCVKKPILYGSWCNRDSYVDYQDIVIFSKE